MTRIGYIDKIRKHPTYYTGYIRRMDGKGNKIAFSSTQSFKVFDVVEFDMPDRTGKAYTHRPHVEATNIKLIQRKRRDV